MPAFEFRSHPITERLWLLATAFEAHLTQELAAIGLTVAEFRLVGEVMRSEDGLRQSELAARLGVTAATISAAVTRLERAGVLVRQADPAEPRARIVRLAHSAPLEPGLLVLDALEARALASLSPTQRSELPQLLDRLIRNLTPEDS